MTFLPRLTLLSTLLASTCLHAEPLVFTPCSDTAAPDSLCSGLNVPGSYDAQGRAIGIKAVFFGLALASMATLWMAVFADVGASLLVVANGLRLLRKSQQA